MLADALGVVVDLVCGVEPGLERAAVADVVAGVAPGRVTRRRLAQTLAERPSLLVDGRSPAPRVAGHLLVALRQAGAVRVSPPCCAECGKQLRTFQRRGQDWFCSVCASRRERCAGCGNLRQMHSRDRQGRPRCASCPPEDGRDPVELVVEVVACVDPTLDAEAVAAAVRTVTSRAGQRRQLGWALQDRPELLTGAGAEAPVPSVLRLIEALCEAGAQRIVRPACPHCERVIALSKTWDGLRVCRNCDAKARAEPCAGCGAVRQPAMRDERGRPRCPHCLSTDAANQEDCVGCGRRRPVSVRSPQGPLCATCRPVPTRTCSICGRSAACELSKVTGRPWCRACSKRWARCVGCGQVQPVRGGSLTEPLCATCTRPDASFWRACPSCGQGGQLGSGPCARCRLKRRLSELLADATGEIRPELQALHEALAAVDRPATVSQWLRRSTVRSVLVDLATGRRSLSHDALDALPPGKPVEHLRSVLVATAALPARDEQLARIERWVTQTVNERSDPEHKQVLHRYAVWHLLRRLRQRNRGVEATYGQVDVVRQRIRAAVGLLDWLRVRGLTLAACGQGDLDAWLASSDVSRRAEAGHFVRWAISQHINRNLQFAATRWTGPAGPLDEEERWRQARRLLHDDSLDTGDRVAGLLLLLYAQRAATISRLTIDDVDTRDGAVTLRLGSVPVVLPEPLAALTRKLIATRRGHATLGDQATCPWLFPGGQPGRPLSADRLGERLRLLGISPAQARSAALFQLATELPAAILARMLGIHIKVAVAWQQAAAGDWTGYAADVARRSHHQENP